MHTNNIYQILMVKHILKTYFLSYSELILVQLAAMRHNL